MIYVFIFFIGHCKVPDHMRKFVEDCTGAPGFTNEERNFGISWNISDEKTKFYYKYRSAYSIKGIPFNGRIDT